jgi:hypothetical protein
MATKVQKRIQEAYAACYRLCCGERDADEWLTRSLEEARKSEVGHRKMGARFTRGAASYKLPIADAARFFAVKWFLNTQAAPQSFAQACEWREDALYAFAARDRVRDSSAKAETWLRLYSEYQDVRDLDYSEVFAA